MRSHIASDVFESGSHGEPPTAGRRRVRAGDRHGERRRSGSIASAVATVTVTATAFIAPVYENRSRCCTVGRRDANGELVVVPNRIRLVPEGEYSRYEPDRVNEWAGFLEPKM
ncbi:hypothetical protein [Natrinema halophilum]|uniref:hypothetical protein n=1 Tax=Natrinema halophilum TaxID=1699371 RepID=UPI001F2B3370|nr:hypothetical protein [Natrinema halophilum]UHQ96050.1 hypothetical protein HYG82_20950 [Natrinema halophilum]